MRVRIEVVQCRPSALAEPQDGPARRLRIGLVMRDQDRRQAARAGMREDQPAEILAQRRVEFREGLVDRSRRTWVVRRSALQAEAPMRPL
jgi:hypothetical protein